MSNQTERLLQILVETSFRTSPTPTFPLSSGEVSRYYVDCKMALSYPEFRKILGEWIADRIRNLSINAVGGLELGAYPIATAVSDAIYREQGKTVRAFIVRKDPKSHGLKKRIEGDVREGDRVLIVDDVITTGNSTIDAILKSREFGLEVIKAIAIIDRQEFNGTQNIESHNVDYEALVTLEDLSNVQAHALSLTADNRK